MISEQKNTLQIFKHNLKKYQNDKIVIYGTGINAEAIVENCTEFQITGLMDAAKTGERLWGLKVLSQEEIAVLKVKYIVVAARPSVHGIIYKRIQNWAEKNHITVLDIYGNRISEKIWDMEIDSSYFFSSYDYLLREIDKYDVISFDIFNTLLLRYTYEPQDVFRLMDPEFAKKYSFVFSQRRIEAAQELLMQGETDIYAIYRRLAEMENLTEEECVFFLHCEIEQEKTILTVRQKMVDCLNYCKDHHKEVYLVTDMYLTKTLLEEILHEKGIYGYEDIFISCEYGVSKQTGLFLMLKNRIGTKPCLHIGDSRVSDYEAAHNAGMASFEIMSPIHMMEISCYADLLSETDQLEKRLMIGMLAAKVFNNPFALYQSKGKITVDSISDFGYVFLGPLTAAFVIWVLKQMTAKSDGLLLFSSRDGWLIQKIYHLMAEKFGISDLPKDEYLFISRSFILKVIERKEDMTSEYRQYIAYLKKMGLFDTEQIYFLDFMSRGTCQWGLENITEKKTEGLYMQRSLCGEWGKDHLSVKAFYKETSAFDKDRKIFGICDFLECIFTSPQPVFSHLNKLGEPVFEKEIRSFKQLDTIQKVQSGIQNFCEEFADDLAGIPQNELSPEFCDIILRFMEEKYSKIELDELLNMKSDDVLYGSKTVGKDIFM